MGGSHEGQIEHSKIGIPQALKQCQFTAFLFVIAGSDDTGCTNGYEYASRPQMSVESPLAFKESNA